MEVVEVDFSRMMHLVEECGKEGTREGEEEPQDVEQGLFGLGLLTVKRGIMPGGKMINFRWKILHLFFRNSLVRSGRHCGELQKSRSSLEGGHRKQELIKVNTNYAQDSFVVSPFIFPGRPMLPSPRPLPGQSEGLPLAIWTSKLQASGFFTESFKIQ